MSFKRYFIRRLPGDRAGFTLIELLITASIMGIIAFTVISTFASGLNVYTRMRDYSGAQVDVLLALEKMEKELRNLFDFSQIAFEGGREKLSFAGLVSAEGDGENACSQLGRVTYYFNGGKGELIRKQQNYAQAVSKRTLREVSSETLANVKDVDFSYYSYDSENKEYIWLDSWEAEEGDEEEKDEESFEEDAEDEENPSLPLAVKIEMTFKNRERALTLTRTVFIPLAVSRHKQRSGETEIAGEGAVDDDIEDEEGGEADE